jgi:hypothetical protein
MNAPEGIDEFLLVGSDYEGQTKLQDWGEEQQVSKSASQQVSEKQRVRTIVNLTLPNDGIGWGTRQYGAVSEVDSGG